MEKGTVLILGILEKRGEEVAFFRKCVEDMGHKVMVVDIGRQRESMIPCEVTRQEVAKEAGTSPQELSKMPRKEAQDLVVKGAIPLVKKLCEEKKPVGVTCLGGTTTGLMAATIMQELPFGLPKLILSTAAGVKVAQTWWGTMDVTIMSAPAHLVGLNNTVKSLVTRAAGGICGMVERSLDVDLTKKGDKPTVAMTLNGQVEKCVAYIREALKQKGYEITTFHAQGIGDAAMEKQIREGNFDALVDMVPRRVSEQMFGGRTARPAHEVVFESAGDVGIPQVIAPGACNVVGLPKEHPEFPSRKKFWMDQNRPLSRITAEESVKLAEVMAEKLNKATGPVKFLVPMKGWSTADMEGMELYDPETDRIFTEAFKKNIKSDIEVKEVDAWIGDEEFSEQVVKAFEEVTSK